MKVIILAAGLGSRLDDSKERLPKPLTKLINGKSILEYQLGVISTCLSLDQVLIVVGYHKEAIINLFPDLLYVYNPSFAQENTSKSLLKALEKVDDDVLWMNGDVIFNSLVLRKILKLNRTGMVVNRALVGEEEVKYRTDGHGRILEVSKHVIHPEGEALGINFFKREDLTLLKTCLEHCQPSDYFEKGIELAIQQDLGVYTILVDSTDCAEIDFPEDLVIANQMLKFWII